MGKTSDSKRFKTVEVNGWTFVSDTREFKNDECEKCGGQAFSYNEDGELLCEECLINWAEKN